LIRKSPRDSKKPYLKINDEEREKVYNGTALGMSMVVKELGDK